MEESDLNEPPVTYQEWRISNFRDQFEQKHPLDSHIFEFMNANWFLRIYPHDSKSGGNISFYLYREGHENEHVFFRIWIEGPILMIKKDFEKRHTFTVGSNNCGYDGFLSYEEFHKFCRLHYTNESTFPIFCLIRVADEPLLTNYEPWTLESEDAVPLTEDYGDFKIMMTVNGETFRAKPKILSENSKFFARKLRENMMWMYKPIEMDGCDPDTFDEFLQFLNNMDISIVTPNNMIGLYKNSWVCEIPELKAECIKCMKLQLSVDTFCEIHGAAVMKNETDLLDSVTQFFIDNAKSIVESTKWQEHLKSNHLRCNELFFKFLSSPIVN